MPYAMLQDMVDRFGETELIQMSDRSMTATAIDAAVVAAKLADADAEIDGYLGQRFTLPLASVPPVLKRIATDLARYHLYDDRATEQVTKRYNDAIAFLKGVAKGDLSIGVDAGGEEPAQAMGTPAFVEGESVFSRAQLRDFIG